MHAEGVESHSRKEIRLMITKQELPALGSHLSHKEATAGRCLQCSFYVRGIRAKDKDMCFHALERRCGEYLNVQTQARSIHRFAKKVLMSSL